MRNLRLLMLVLLGGLLAPAAARAFELRGEAIQGGLMFGKTVPGSHVTLDGSPVMVSPKGAFVIGFGRDDSGVRHLSVAPPGGAPEERELQIAPHEYHIERIDGLPPETVTPPPEVLERIQKEAELVAEARARRDQRDDFSAGFTWPANGRLSGFYGSQRVLNGEPRRPHYGVDVAAPVGTPVHAPAAGVVTLADPDMYYSGGTIVLDHGLGLSSTFLHLSEILVTVGQRVRQGDLIGRIGATGRATGPHLDWRMNWLDKRVDPQRLVGAMPDEEPGTD